MDDRPPAVRERTRRSAQNEIAAAAWRWFVEHGYEATTVDDIAAAAGLPERDIFRYFATKEDIVLGKFDLASDDMLHTLRSRPMDEPVWTSLHRVFDLFASFSDAPGQQAFAVPLYRVIFEAPPLIAGYRHKLQKLQDAVVALLVERAARTGTPYRVDDPTPRALTASAFGCLVAAQYSWLASGATGSFSDAVDRAMSVVGPPRP